MQDKQQKFSNPAVAQKLLVRNLLGQPPSPYKDVWQAMRQFTQLQTPTTLNEIWLLEHQAIYTLGKAGDEKHLLQQQQHIPLLRSDRGGQITYHGPGQWMLYCLWDLKSLNIGIRSLVQKLQLLISQLCLDEGIKTHTREDAPGVYVNNKKICAIGLRVSRGRCYHGLACNIKLDLSPFHNINPCGYSDLKATSWEQELKGSAAGKIANKQWKQQWLLRLQQQLRDIFGFTDITISQQLPPQLSATKNRAKV